MPEEDLGPPLEGGFDEADVFIAPKVEQAPRVQPIQGGLEDVDAMVLRLVEITIDEDDVPIRVDGVDQGTVPGAIQVRPGPHKVELYFRGTTSEFELEATRDPDQWCFERRGRSFRQRRC